jgi:hypothetical protein
MLRCHWGFPRVPNGERSHPTRYRCNFSAIRRLLKAITRRRLTAFLHASLEWICEPFAVHLQMRGGELNHPVIQGHAAMAGSPERRFRGLAIVFVAGMATTGQPAAAADDKGSEIFTAARAAVASGRVAKTDALGFTLEKKAFSEAPAEGGVLVGFDVGLGKFLKDECIYALRPIYRTAQGEVTYQDFGIFHSPAQFGPKKFARKEVIRTVRLMAQADYAVGGITLRTSVNIRGMSLTFMRINGQTLDPKQSYATEWVGDSKGGREASVGSDSAPIVGVFGNQNDDQQVVALGLIYIDDGSAVAASAQAALARQRRSHSGNAQPSKPSSVDKLKELVSKEEAASASAEKDNAEAVPPNASDAQEKPPAEEAVAPARNAGAEESEKDPVPLWQSWKVMAPAALAILLASVVFGVQRFRPQHAAPEAASALPVGSGNLPLRQGSVCSATPVKPRQADPHKKLNAIIAVVVAVAAGLFSYELAKGKFNAPKGFHEFTSAEGKFRVEMPGTPTQETIYAVGFPLVTFRVEEEDGAYGVAYADVPMIQGISSTQLEQALKSARDGMISNVHGKFLGESKIRLDGKYPGREVRAELPIKDGLIKGRLYVVGSRIYMVMVTGLSSWVNSANAKRFLDSLEVTR